MSVKEGIDAAVKMNDSDSKRSAREQKQARNFKVLTLQYESVAVYVKNYFIDIRDLLRYFSTKIY